MFTVCWDFEHHKVACSPSGFWANGNHEINRWGLQTDVDTLTGRRPQLTWQIVKCNVGIMMFILWCKTFFLNKHSDATSLVGLSKTRAALPPHHFRDRIYCCSLGAEPSASEDSVWMTSQLCNRPILKNMLCVCVCVCVSACVFVGKHLERWMLMWLNVLPFPGQGFMAVEWAGFCV